MRFFSALLLSLLLTYSISAQQQLPDPPQAALVADTLILHGDTLIDNYSWMRKKGTPEVVKYLSAENEYARRVMRQSEWFQDKLYEEVIARLPENEESLPVRIDSFYYYNRYTQGKQYQNWYRRKATADSTKGKTKEELVLNLNTEAEKTGGFLMLMSFNPSPNQQILAYGLNFTGDRKISVFFKDLISSQVDSVKLENVGDISWANDSRTLYYTTLDTTFRANKVWRWQRGTPTDSAQLLYTETNNRFQLALSKTQSDKYIVLLSGAQDSETTELRMLDANNPLAEPQLVVPRKAGLLYRVQHINDTFYVESNRLSRAGGIDYFTDLAKPEIENWKPYLPANDSVQLEGVVFFANHLAVLERSNFQQKLKVIDKISGNTHYLTFKEEVYSLGLGSNPNPDDSVLQFTYSSLTTPATTFAYNLYTGKSKSLKVQKVKGGFNSALYTSERVWATAPDGTRVPVSLVYKSSLKKDGNNPTLLIGYGAYGNSSNPYFSTSRISLLERGFVFAVAHIRGGGDGGFAWHDGGKMLNKQNTFTDFIAASERLIALGFTKPEKLVIDGGSAGGLLIGAVINKRPDLYKAALLNVPFVDVINTMLDSSLPLTTFEWEEWGNPAIEGQYRYIREYSPYENVTAQNYPHLLIQGGYNDSQVGYWEPAKLAARLRERKTDNNLLLLRISMDGGHGLTAGRYNNVRQLALEWAFIFNVLGIEEDYGMVRGRVKDPNGEALPYVTVYDPQTGAGATTNEEGEFVMELKRGNYQLQVRQVGFQTSYLKITPENLNDYQHIKLVSEDEMLQQVEVKADAINPAYIIMNKAIENRKKHLNELESFSSQVYIKNITRLDHLPKKWPKILGNDVPDSSDLGVVYLSESVSEYSFKKPDFIKEKMISSKVAGRSQGFSWNRASEIQVNFYENLVNISDLAPRGVISPLAENAMFFYRFDYDGYKIEGGKEISKIKVVPKRSSDPVFSGYVYIVEDEWRLASTDLYLTNKQVELFDSLRIQQDFVQLADQQTADSLRVPSTMQISAKIKIFGIGASANSYTFYQNLKANPVFTKKYFTNEIFSIAQGANQKTNEYWQGSRPIMLTEEERLNYQSKDSLEAIINSKPYLDSVDAKNNRFSLSGLVMGGYNWRNSYRKQSISTSNLLELVQYNTVEGVNLNAGVAFTQRYKDSWKYWSIKGGARYAVGKEKPYAYLKYQTRYNTYHSGEFSAEAGHNTTQFNQGAPIKPLVNTLYSLQRRANYMKLYERTYLYLFNSYEPLNGIRISVSLNYEDRKALRNIDGYTAEGELRENLTSNNPLKPDVKNSIAFEDHQALTASIGLRIRFRQRYETMANGRWVYPSKYPTLKFNYTKGLPIAGANTDFDALNIGVYDDMDFALLGKAKWSVTAGAFLSKANLLLPNWQHFNGNQTKFLNRSGNDINSFHLLPYYDYSTTGRFLEGHYEHHFNGFLVNKIPLLRKTKFQVVGGVNYLHTQEQGNYYEAFAGIENILKVIRLDWATSFSKDAQLSTGIRIGVTMQ